MFKLEHALYLSVYTLRKSLQTASTSPCRIYVTDFVSLIYNLKTVF
ncbi:hypothetical protein PNI0164_00983 [Streptococcus pneumoniae PNI0164]|nr:hypothetical protein PNI0164_00983 [Streptococcus pneumoniae PNI0164]